jgi:hypothetical protein
MPEGMNIAVPASLAANPFTGDKTIPIHLLIQSLRDNHLRRKYAIPQPQCYRNAECQPSPDRRTLALAIRVSGSFGKFAN